MRRKRAKGTSHKLAMQNSRRLRDSFSDLRDGPSSGSDAEGAGEPEVDRAPDENTATPAAPPARKLPDKEVVAAAMRRKRAKGTSHKLAMQNSRRLRDSFSDLMDSSWSDAEGDHARFSDASDAEVGAPGAAVGVVPRGRGEGRRPGDVLPAADAFEEALSEASAGAAVAPRRRRRDNYLSASAPVNPAGRGEVKSDADRYQRRLEKMMRKLSTGAADEVEDERRGQTNGRHLAASLLVNSTRGGDRYETMLDKLTRKLSAEGAAAGNGKDESRG